MEDKELIALAAKASALDYCARASDGMGFVLSDSYRIWNPLTDDGDALRLAVKCGFAHNLELALGYYTTREDFDRDPCAAYRRAIVCAAAEIGQQANAGVTGAKQRSS